MDVRQKDVATTTVSGIDAVTDVMTAIRIPTRRFRLRGIDGFTIRRAWTSRKDGTRNEMSQDDAVAISAMRAVDVPPAALVKAYKSKREGICSIPRGGRMLHAWYCRLRMRRGPMAAVKTGGGGMEQEHGDGEGAGVMNG